MTSEAAPADDYLKAQSLVNLDVAKLTPLSPEVISRQATINIGTIGHVAHGKSTIVRAISGVQTVRFKNEKERNITIKLGYANAKLYRCTNPDCPPPERYASYGSSMTDDPPCKREGCGHKMQVIRHVSFVDCPGHDILMATMLNGAAVMDAALLLIAGNEPCPQPQTSEHLAAIEIMKLKHIIVLQNKVELVKKEESQSQYEQIRSFIKGTVASKSPIIPISAVLKYNIDTVIEYLCTQIPVPVRDFTAAPHMIIIRSFDVNKPGEAIDTLKGGVAGGSILKGVLKVGDIIECRPGQVIKDNEKITCRPIRSQIVSLFAEQNELQFAVPGGLIGVGTNIDPTFTRADRLVGNVLGMPGFMPEVFSSLKVNYYLLRRVLGIKPRRAKSVGTTAGTSNAPSRETSKTDKVAPIKVGEFLLVNIGSTSVGARVESVKEDTAKFKLDSAICTRVGDNIALSRRVEKNWRLIGFGNIVKGTPVELLEPF